MSRTATRGANIPASFSPAEGLDVRALKQATTHHLPASHTHPRQPVMREDSASPASLRTPLLDHLWSALIRELVQLQLCLMTNLHRERRVPGNVLVRPAEELVGGYRLALCHVPATRVGARV